MKHEITEGEEQQLRQMFGDGTSTLDMLYNQHPWLKEMIETKDARIKELEERINAET